MNITTEDKQHESLEHGGQTHGEHDDLDQGLPDQRTQEKAFDDKTEGEAPYKR